MVGCLLSKFVNKNVLFLEMRTQIEDGSKLSIYKNKNNSITEAKEEDEILYYIHKKFQKTISVSDLKPNVTKHPSIIRSVKISNGPKNNSNTFGSGATNVSSTPVSVIQQRKSVIVKRTENFTPVEKGPIVEIEFNENLDNDFDNEPKTLSLNMLELENLFTFEEENYFQHTQSKFVNCLKEIPFGEGMMQEYISFSYHQHPLSMGFMKMISSVLKTRMLNFITSVEDMSSLPVETQFRLLKKGLMHCIVMTKVWGFNVPDVYEEIGLVLSYQDLDQFQVQY